MQHERRRTERAQISLEVMWDGDKGRNKGEVIDISTGGCFVLSGGIYKERELIKLEIYLPVQNQVIYVWGMVANTFPEMGFGISFTSISDADMALVNEVIIKEKWNNREPQVVLPNGQSFIPGYA